jgi:hypothetical protein
MRTTTQTDSPHGTLLAAFRRGLAVHTAEMVETTRPLSDTARVDQGMHLPYTGGELGIAVKALTAARAVRCTLAMTDPDDLAVVWSADTRKTVRAAVLANPAVSSAVIYEARCAAYDGWWVNQSADAAFALIAAGEYHPKRADVLDRSTSHIVAHVRAHGVIDTTVAYLVTAAASVELTDIPVDLGGADQENPAQLAAFVTHWAPSLHVRAIAQLWANVAIRDQLRNQSTLTKHLTAVVDTWEAGLDLLPRDVLRQVLDDGGLWHSGVLALGERSIDMLIDVAPGSMQWCDMTVDVAGLAALPRASSVLRGTVTARGDLTDDALHRAAFDLPQDFSVALPDSPAVHARIAELGWDTPEVQRRVSANDHPLLDARVSRSPVMLASEAKDDPNARAVLMARIMGDSGSYPLASSARESVMLTLLRTADTLERLVEVAPFVSDTDRPAFDHAAAVRRWLRFGGSAAEIVAIAPNLVRVAALKADSGEWFGDRLSRSSAMSSADLAAFAQVVSARVFEAHTGFAQTLTELVFTLAGGNRVRADEALERATELALGGFPGTIAQLAATAVALSEPAVPAVV